MKIKLITAIILVMAVTAIIQITHSGQYYHPEFRKSSYGVAYAYPPAVGILSDAENCVACHADNGPWKDDSKMIIDILDKATKESFMQIDGSFLVKVKRNQVINIITVIGRAAGDKGKSPYRNAFLYIDPATIGTNSLSKFAPGWDMNLPMSCKITGDKLQGYEGAMITIVPSSIRPTDSARDAELTLQVMLTEGNTIKGDAAAGTANYFERKVKLMVTD